MNTFLYVYQFMDSDPQAAATYLAADRVVQEAELDGLARKLANDPYCSRADIAHLMDLLEEHMLLQESLSVLNETD